MYMCLGDQGISTTPREREWAQLYVYELFRANFLSRYADGVVFTELEYMARTVSAPINPDSLSYPGRPNLTRIMKALSVDFRRWIKMRDYRKFDGVGIGASESIADRMHDSAQRQVGDHSDAR